MSGESRSAARTSLGSPFALAVLAVLWAASAGALLGAAAAWTEIQMHGYAELAFWRSTASVLREESLPACALGARVAFVLALVWILLKDAGVKAQDGEISKRPLVAALHRGEVLASVLTVTLACIGLLLERGVRPDLSQLAAVLIAACTTWLVLALAYQRADPPLRARLRPAALAFVAFALYVTRARWASMSHVDVELGAKVVLAAILAFFALVAWNALLSHGSVGRPRAWVRGLLWIGALPTLVFPFASAFLPRPVLHAAQGAPNVLVIGIDSLRLDHTAFAEHPASARELTPNLARLAARGTVFQNAISQASWTMPSFASIFTGKYPHQHGAVSAKGYLREREMTLAEILREAGYATAGIVSHDYVNAAHGFAQGCEHFDAECVQGEKAITSRGISDRAIEYLKQRDERPFYLFLHYFDPHYEYRDHDDSNFADGYDGWLKSELNIENVRLKRHWLGAAEKQWLVDLYDEEIVFTDRQIGRVLDQLEQSGLAESTLVVFVVDHGEEFFEHGWIGHCITLYDEVLHVPLVIALPGKESARKVADVVETRSVFSTVLDVVGCAWGEESRPESLLSLVKGASAKAPADALGKLAFSSVWTPDSKPDIGQQARMFCVRSAKWKLISDQSRATQSLFDLEHDPGEQHEVSREHPAELAALKAALEPWMECMHAALGRVVYKKLDPAERARLEALGYL